MIEVSGRNPDDLCQPVGVATPLFRGAAKAISCWHALRPARQFAHDLSAINTDGDGANRGSRAASAPENITLTTLDW